jgi:hypothetical protein
LLFCFCETISNIVNCIVASVSYYKVYVLPWFFDAIFFYIRGCFTLDVGVDGRQYAFFIVGSNVFLIHLVMSSRVRPSVFFRRVLHLQKWLFSFLLLVIFLSVISYCCGIKFLIICSFWRTKDNFIYHNSKSHRKMLFIRKIFQTLGRKCLYQSNIFTNISHEAIHSPAGITKASSSLKWMLGCYLLVIVIIFSFISWIMII